MINYDIFINEGNDNIGRDKRTITINTVKNVTSQKEFLRLVHNLNPTIPIQTIEDVVTNTFEAICLLLSDGHSVSLKNRKGTLATVHPDTYIDGGSIDLERARELCPDVQEITPENAAQLVNAAGVKVRPKFRCSTYFSKELHDAKPQIEARDVVVREKDRHNTK